MLDFTITSVRSKNLYLDLFLIAIIWVIMIIFVNPFGDFPLNDDWVYAKSVKSIIENQNFTLSQAHSASNLIVQAFWGALFCLPRGFSYNALRFSTLTLGLIGLFFIYLILTEINIDRFYRILGVFLIGFNPIYFSLSNTFMTDIPFFTFAIVSIYFLIKGLKYDNKKNIILGILFSYLSLLIRQNGIIITLSFSITYLLKNKINLKNIIKSFIPIVLGILIQLSYEKWLENTNRNSPALNLQANKVKEIILSENFFKILDIFIDNTFVALIYIGLFLSPLIFILLLNHWGNIKIFEKKYLIFTTLTGSIVMGIWLWKVKQKIMPLSGNILLSFGIGPLTFHDTYYLEKNIPSIPIYLQIIWSILTIIGVISASLLSYYFFKVTINLFSKQNKDTTEKSLNIFIISIIILFYLPMGIQGYFERYLLLLLPLFILQIMIIFRKYTINYLPLKNILPILIIMFMCAMFSVGGTHDYISWNRERWKVLNNLTENLHISPHYIDGGYEFNGSYLYNADYKEKAGKSWWWVDKDDYILSFGLLENYQEIDRSYFKTYLPFSPKYFLVLKRNSINNNPI